jgi:hypothetical protein
LTGNQQFKTACAAFIFNSSFPTVAPATAFGDGLTLNYTSATDSYGITGDGLALTYGPGDIDPAAPTTIKAYVRTTGGFTERFTIGRPGAGGVALDYMRGFSLRALKGPGPTQYSCVFGVPTLVTDPPAATSVTFTKTGLNGSAYRSQGGIVGIYSLEKSTVTLSVNLTTGKINTVIHLLGTLQTPAGPSTTNVELGTYTGSGDIDEVQGSYNGQFTDASFAYFGGWFFGPQGREAGFAYSIFNRDAASGADVTAVGTVAAIQ